MYYEEKITCSFDSLVVGSKKVCSLYSLEIHKEWLGKYHLYRYYSALHYNRIAFWMSDFQARLLVSLVFYGTYSNANSAFLRLSSMVCRFPL